MLSLGWVIFWKCVVVGAWGGIAARWAAFRSERKAIGLPMRYDSKRQVYVVSDWTAAVDRGVRKAGKWIVSLIFFWWAILALFLLSGREAMLADLIRRLLP